MGTGERVKQNDAQILIKYIRKDNYSTFATQVNIFITLDKPFELNISVRRVSIISWMFTRALQ